MKDIVRNAFRALFSDLDFLDPLRPLPLRRWPMFLTKSPRLDPPSVLVDPMQLMVLRQERLLRLLRVLRIDSVRGSKCCEGAGRIFWTVWTEFEAVEYMVAGVPTIRSRGSMIQAGSGSTTEVTALSSLRETSV